MGQRWHQQGKQQNAQYFFHGMNLFLLVLIKRMTISSGFDIPPRKRRELSEGPAERHGS